MKLIAFYLPQFHTIPENDRWWGKGFTEWTNTRKSKPLFAGHYQPREPLQDYYYELTDPAARKWQAEMAKKYGIYGFCYYHYWFKGKTLLETPFNEVLRSGEPDLPFCLSWANEPWTRTWDGLDDEVLMPQNYGDEEDWEDHFYYLLPAFRDQRYIRIDEKPVFIIYRPASIPRCSEMLKYWDGLAKQYDLNGIYFIDMLNGFEITSIEGFHASIEFEPAYTWKHCTSDIERWAAINEVDGKDRRFDLFDYDMVWLYILRRVNARSDKKIFLGAFVDWDNSPRRGSNASIFDGANPEKFSKYLNLQIQKSISLYKNAFLFINAWNEWAEGTYLEPDKKYGFGYLEAVRKALENNGIN